MWKGKIRYYVIARRKKNIKKENAFFFCGGFEKRIILLFLLYFICILAGHGEENGGKMEEAFLVWAPTRLAQLYVNFNILAREELFFCCAWRGRVGVDVHCSALSLMNIKAFENDDGGERRRRPWTLEFLYEINEILGNLIEQQNFKNEKVINFSIGVDGNIIKLIKENNFMLITFFRQIGFCSRLN